MKSLKRKRNMKQNERMQQVVVECNHEINYIHDNNYGIMKFKS